MKFRAVFYPLICVAIIFAIAAFLIVKNYHPNNNSTTQAESSINNKNNDLNNTTDDASTDEDDGVQTLIEDQDVNDGNSQDDNSDEDNTADQTDKENNTNPSQNNSDKDNESNTDNDDTHNDDDDDKDDGFINPIQPTNDVKIVLYDCCSNTIVTSSDVICLNYAIVDGNKQYINQDVNIIIEDKTVCGLMSQCAPFIYLQKQGMGKTTVKIVSANNSSVFKTITIIFD